MSEQTVCGERQLLIAKSVENWSKDLIALDARNRLLYFKEMKAGTLCLDGADPDTLASLLRGDKVRLSSLFQDPPDSDTVATDVERPDGAAVEEEQEPHADAARRCRTISNKAREDFEERGIRTLHIAWGFASWNSPRSKVPINAPVLLADLELTASTVRRTDFEVRIVAEEWELNPNIAHALNSDLKVDVDVAGIAAVPVGKVGADTWREISNALSKAPGFSLAQRLQVANLSYTKLPLVEDLKKGLEEGFLAESSMVAAIAGDSSARRELQERLINVNPEHFDSEPARNEFLVLDADSSQSAAINTALGGSSIVIEGPPGTGKSQTIANLIATHIAAKKRVLFVAEKRAAIEAVAKRLDQVGLGSLVLDAHGGRLKPKDLYEQFSTCLDLAAKFPARSQDQEARNGADELDAARNELAGWNELLHEVQEPWAASVFDMQAAAIECPEHLRRELPMSSSLVNSLTPEYRDDIEQRLRQFAQLEGPRIRTGLYGEVLRSGKIPSREETEELVQALRETHQVLLRRLRLNVGALDLDGQFPTATSVDDVIERSELAAGVTEVLADFSSEIFSVDLEGVLAAMHHETKGFIRRRVAYTLDSAYRDAKRKMLSLCVTDSRRHDLFEKITHAQAVSMSWARLSTAEPPRQLAGASDLQSDLSALLEHLETIGSRVGSKFDTQTDLDQLACDIREYFDSCTDLFKLPEIARLLESFEKQELGYLVRELDPDVTSDEAAALFRHIWSTEVLNHLRMANPGLGSFRGAHHDEVARRFTNLDRDHISGAPERVLHKWAQLVSEKRAAHPDQDTVLRHQIGLKRPRKRIRELLEEAPSVATSLKPCWVMSPLNVAQLLPRQTDLFDVVVFDEASQIQPADAICALTRAPQAVIAGDSKQLPPTHFFHSAADDSTDSADSDMSLSVGLESLLDVVKVLLPVPLGTKTLCWHYRSQDERLITVSNAQPELYNWGLTTFPGVVEDCLRFEKVNVESLMKRGPSSPDEVERVVDLMFEHALTRPDESLGVIALGAQHSNAIEERLRRRLIPGSEAEAYFSAENGIEPWFIKNLERVQGDERDAIILSVGYTKTPDGRMNYNFGPVTSAGGHRRLNVAASRARKRMTVVSAFSASDMDPRRLRSVGPQMLRSLLKFAESGGTCLAIPKNSTAKPNPFERDIQEALEAAGIPLTAQHGQAGYFIDLAAHHPENKGDYVLAIECDGASYHSSPTARERDRLRQEHLERLGWKFHRIWSTEWFQNREGEIKRAVDAWRAAVANSTPDLATDDDRYPASTSVLTSVKDQTPAKESDSEPCSPLRLAVAAQG